MTRAGLFFLICFFIFQGSFTSYAQNNLAQSNLKKEILEIKEEIKQLLRDKQNNSVQSNLKREIPNIEEGRKQLLRGKQNNNANTQNINFSILLTEYSNSKAHLDGLKNLKEGIEKTQNIKDIRKINGWTIQTYPDNKGGLELSHSIYSPPEGFIAAMSENAYKEPVLQKLLKENRLSTFTIGARNEIIWFVLAGAIRQIIEEKRNAGNSNTQNINLSDLENYLANNKEPLDLLKNFKEALEKTQSIKNIQEIKITEKEKSAFTYKINEKEFKLLLPIKSSPEELIAAISKNAYKEPALQKFLKEKEFSALPVYSQDYIRRIMLEGEIKYLLENKQNTGNTNTQDTVFYYSEYTDITHTEFIHALENLKKALKKTKNIKNFVNLSGIYITKKENSRIYTDEEETIPVFSIDEPIESWMILLSEKPDEEPRLKKYWADKKAALDKKLKERFGEQFILHEAGRKILCEHEGISSNAREIKKMATDLTGKSVKNVYFEKYNYDIDGTYFRVAEIKLSSPSQEIILIGTFYNKEDEKQYSYVEINKGDNWSIYRSRLNISLFDKNCHFTRAEINERDKYDPQNHLLKVHYLDVNGDIEHTALANPPVKSLEEIYGDCANSDELIKLIKEIEERKRILVTVLDRGFNPDNLNLAYAIHRPNKIMLDQLRKLKEDRRLAYEELEKLSESGKQNKEKELLAKISSLSDAIKNKKEEMEYSILFWNSNNSGTYSNILDLSYDFRRADDINHGTLVAGVIVAESNQIALLPISAALVGGMYTAIQHAYDKGSRLTNISLGITSDDTSLNSPIGMTNFGFSRAVTIHKDMLFVISAGNESLDVDGNPLLLFSKRPNVLLVAATDQGGKLADFSNFGSTSVGVAAPGVDIPIIGGNNVRNIASGTSLAAPFVTNIAAKIKLINPKLTPEEIIKIIMDTVDKKPGLEGKIQSGGIVNKARALARARATLNN